MAAFKNILLVIFIINLRILVTNGQLPAGSNCKLENKQRGVCKIFDDCPSALKQVATEDKWPLICNYEGSTMIVCCETEKKGDTGNQTTTSTTTTTTTTTKKPTTMKRKKTTTAAPVTVPIANNNEPTGILSRKKCREYSKWLKVPLLAFDEEDKIAGKCGINVETFIIGGTKAENLEFPHMAHLGFKDEEDAIDQLEWSCGGSLISENFVLTAAHCLQKSDGTKVTHVRLGWGDKPSRKIVKVAQQIPHPYYNKQRSYNDIALLKLAENVTFNDFLRPACLQANKRFKDKEGIASGWGATEKEKESKKLLKVKLPFVSYEECSETFKPSPIRLPHGLDESTMICAGGGSELKKDTCQGDSGGPLQLILNNPYCMYSIVGITSFGIKCAIAPGVYTRVSSYIPWIESQVWPSG